MSCPQIIQSNTPVSNANQKPQRTPYLHQHIIPRMSSDPEPRVSDILHLYIREYHLKVSIIPATQVSGRAFTELQKEQRRLYKPVTVMSSWKAEIMTSLSQTPKDLTHRAFLNQGISGEDYMFTTAPPKGNTCHTTEIQWSFADSTIVNDSVNESLITEFPSTGRCLKQDWNQGHMGDALHKPTFTLSSFIVITQGCSRVVYLGYLPLKNR